MNTVMGLINLQDDNRKIREMTENRPVGSIPFAGRYRVIDFTLSSMVNSGIGHVGIMLPMKSRSIMDHLRSGKDWDLARRHEGLFYLPPAKDDRDTREGDLKNFYHNIDFVEHSAQKYVLLARANNIYNIDFNKVLRFHQNTNADITLVYSIAQEEERENSVVIETAENGLVQDISIKPVVYQGAKVSLGICLMEKRLFVNIVKSAYEHGGTDFVLDGIIRRADHYTMYACMHEGYTACIASMASYYRTSMEVLQPAVWEELFMQNGFIYTKTKDGVPVQYKEDANVTNSLVANGCVVHGEVENSILFRGVTVGKGVKIRNSILMEKCDLKNNALVENVICDKNVTITSDKWLKGAPNYPLVVNKDAVI
ncbi:glucose-1-phosphate adenylyltransferase subunit GlgD [Selenomonas sp. TAMA-11512]|uniref:glucose-1-phosphate adenylyltransferase subunit GlgD n=1 Tax=Selenomonas sp. TAMA-11512 TaxID=3095337 RepID=UPI00308B410D|nr:glucose-1-phosphate adenylyltransferase subunit GlgD [Selenomonas sp. TAMA-11512]